MTPLTGKPGPKRHRPDRDLILRVATEEAKKRRVALDAVLGDSRHRKATEARRSALVRIHQITGCSMASIGRAWGLSPNAVQRAIRLSEARYDTATMARLTWRYGEARALQIAAGKDPNTERDIAAWKRLIGRAEG